jgi:type I restriction enzyme M protein
VEYAANVNILTSLLALRCKNEEEKRAEALGGTEEYPVFMAVAENIVDPSNETVC